MRPGARSSLEEGHRRAGIILIRKKGDRK